MPQVSRNPIELYVGGTGIQGCRRCGAYGVNCASWGRTELNSVVSRQVQVVTGRYWCVPGLHPGSQAVAKFSPSSQLVCLRSPSLVFLLLAALQPLLIASLCASRRISSCSQRSVCRAPLPWTPPPRSPNCSSFGSPRYIPAPSFWHSLSRACEPSSTLG